MIGVSRIVLLFCLFHFYSGLLHAQGLNDVKLHIDDLIQNYDSKLTPGVGGAIVKDGELLYAYISGMANLESGSKNNLQTKFQVDDLAKQFTAYALLNLIDDNIVSLEDDINKYIPELPTFDYSIQIKHVLNHTTGLNDYLRIFEISGGSIDDKLSKSQALNLLGAQKKLLFKPGHSFSIYDSDTEVMLMSLIIAQAVGKSFEEYMHESIFQELGMNNTFFVVNNRNIIENTAHSYEEIDGSFYHKEIAHNISGPSNLYTTVEDLAIWYAYFSPKVTSPIAVKVKRLDTPVTNSLGEKYTSSWGEMKWGQYFRHAERGLPKDWQFGLIGGYGANVFKYPYEDITSFTIGNNNDYNGSIAMNAVEPLLADKYLSPPSIDPDLIETVPIEVSTLESFVGEYFTDSYGVARSIEVRNDSLIYKRPNGELKLLHIGNHRFQAIVQSDDVVIFAFEGKGGNRTYKYSSSGSDPLVYNSFDRVNYTEDELKKFEGIYYNTSLSMTYEVKQEGDKLMLRSFNIPAIEFTPVMENLFNSFTIHMTTIRFDYNANAISGFNIKTGGTGNIRFEKI